MARLRLLASFVSLTTASSILCSGSSSREHESDQLVSITWATLPVTIMRRDHRDPVDVLVDGPHGRCEERSFVQDAVDRVHVQRSAAHPKDSSVTSAPRRGRSVHRRPGAGDARRRGCISSGRAQRRAQDAQGRHGDEIDGDHDDQAGDRTRQPRSRASECDDVGGKDLPGSAGDARHRKQRHRSRRVSEAAAKMTSMMGRATSHRTTTGQAVTPSRSRKSRRVWSEFGARAVVGSTTCAILSGRTREDLRQRHCHDVQPDVLQRQEGCDEHDVDRRIARTTLRQTQRGPEGQRLGRAPPSVLLAPSPCAGGGWRQGRPPSRARWRSSWRRGRASPTLICREQDLLCPRRRACRRSSRGRNDAHGTGTVRHREHHQVQGRADCRAGPLPPWRRHRHRRGRPAPA